ncbi:MAG: 2-oxo acid dehydrogenase subunit E2 [Abditibacteriota bacterium]|nr:2-oxo acid dehydrogenase subunit E2 [Abditibacteriota bacterium]
MAIVMNMPRLGETMEEGTIIKWFKKVGEEVKKGEPLLEVMTDKVNLEVESDADGVLLKVYGDTDDVIPVYEPMCVIGAAGESVEDAASDKKEEPKAEAKAEAPKAEVKAETPKAAEAPKAAAGRVFASPAAKRVARELGVDISAMAGKGTGVDGRVTEADVQAFAKSGKATPLAAKMAKDLGVDTSTLKGTGIGGKVTAADVEAKAPKAAKKEAKAEAAPAAAPKAGAGIGGKLPYAGMRKAVGQNMLLSKQTSPHVTLNMEVDMTNCVSFRKQILDGVQEAYGVRISFTDIIVKAVARAILDFPIINSCIDGKMIVINDHVNIGVATAIEGGLIVPVLKDTDSMSLPEISKAIKEMAAKARSGKIMPEDYAGGTFSISNLGAYGVESFNPVINPGQAAILGVCAIVKKPVVVDDEIKVRSMMGLSLSFDHRIVDGAPAAQFLAAIKKYLESPYMIFM